MSLLLLFNNPQGAVSEAESLITLQLENSSSPNILKIIQGQISSQISAGNEARSILRGGLGANLLIDNSSIISLLSLLNNNNILQINDSNIGNSINKGIIVNSLILSSTSQFDSILDLTTNSNLIILNNNLSNFISGGNLEIDLSISNSPFFRVIRKGMAAGGLDIFNSNSLFSFLSGNSSSSLAVNSNNSIQSILSLNNINNLVVNNAILPFGQLINILSNLDLIISSEINLTKIALLNSETLNEIEYISNIVKTANLVNSNYILIENLINLIKLVDGQCLAIQELNCVLELIQNKILLSDIDLIINSTINLANQTSIYSTHSCVLNIANNYNYILSGFCDGFLSVTNSTRLQNTAGLLVNHIITLNTIGNIIKNVFGSFNLFSEILEDIAAVKIVRLLSNQTAVLDFANQLHLLLNGGVGSQLIINANNLAQKACSLNQLSQQQINNLCSPILQKPLSSNCEIQIQNNALLNQIISLYISLINSIGVSTNPNMVRGINVFPSLSLISLLSAVGGFGSHITCSQVLSNLSQLILMKSSECQTLLQLINSSEFQKLKILISQLITQINCSLLGSMPIYVNSLSILELSQINNFVGILDGQLLSNIQIIGTDNIIRVRDAIISATLEIDQILSAILMKYIKSNNSVQLIDSSDFVKLLIGLVLVESRINFGSNLNKKAVFISNLILEEITGFISRLKSKKVPFIKLDALILREIINNVKIRLTDESC